MYHCLTNSTLIVVPPKFCPTFFPPSLSKYLSSSSSSSSSRSWSCFSLPIMGSQDRGRALPKFGEWDVNNPASAEGYTVIFNKARDQKKTSAISVGKPNTPRRSDSGEFKKSDSYQHLRKNKNRWLCCC